MSSYLPALLNVTLDMNIKCNLECFASIALQN